MCLQIIVAWHHFHLCHLQQMLKVGMLQCRLRVSGHGDKAHQAGCRCECQGLDTVHTSPECSSWHIFCFGNHACKWLSGRCVRCAFAPCFTRTPAILTTDTITLCKAVSFRNSLLGFLKDAWKAVGVSLCSASLPSFDAFPAACVLHCLPQPSASCTVSVLLCPLRCGS